MFRSLAVAMEFHPRLDEGNFIRQFDSSDYSNLLRKSLSRFCMKSDRPLVILFDETDCLSDGTLISFLRQLRDGYSNRSMVPFVHSVGLIGMRNIRDYKGKIREDRESLGSASPFNIVSETFTLRNFTQKETALLYEQHTGQTGQVFPQQAVRKMYHHTQGQPWLVNAVAREIIVKILGSDFSESVCPGHADQAVQNIILRRDTHIDSLLERLREERVRRIVEPVITGKEEGFAQTDDDYRYVLDLGLLTNAGGVLAPSNTIYAEVIIRDLASAAQMSMDSARYPPHLPAYVSGEKLAMRHLLEDFQRFWRENAAIWKERFQYKDAAPHLVLMAFLQRVINRGGQIVREPALGRRRLDLCVHYAGMRYPIELKLRNDRRTYEKGQAQLADYMDRLGCDEGWLVVFDRRKSVSWKKKLFWKTVTGDDRQIHIVGC